MSNSLREKLMGLGFKGALFDLGQQFTHGRRLIVAMLEQQPAARGQTGRGLGDDLADVIQAVSAGGQGLPRSRGGVTRSASDFLRMLLTTFLFVPNM